MAGLGVRTKVLGSLALVGAIGGAIILAARQGGHVPAPAATILKASVPPAAALPVSSKSGAAKAGPPAKPLWSALTPAQRLVLQPMAAEWDKLEGVRKQKWLEIANRYSSMKPDEQQRVQERMREWIKLTPTQRSLARENYARTKKIDKDQKNAKWEQYQQLPEEQRQKLAADAIQKKQVANLPPASQGELKHPPPIKPKTSTPPAPGAAVTPAPAPAPVTAPAGAPVQGVPQPAIQPAPQAITPPAQPGGALPLPTTTPASPAVAPPNVK